MFQIDGCRERREQQVSSKEQVLDHGTSRRRPKLASLVVEDEASLESLREII
jgi:hypothetical protein